jgi:hypothetical protein
MTKRQLIDQIIQVNSTADPGFLARFDPGELDAYLRHLRQARLPRLAGDPHRFDHYFEDAPKVAWRPAPPAAVAVAEPDLPDELELFETSIPAGESAVLGAETPPPDEGLYVAEDDGPLYDAPDPGVTRRRSAERAPEDALDLAYVPVGRDDEDDPPAKMQQQEDSSFAEVEEDAEAWLF